MYWFASDCCKVVFHITRACRLHVRVALLYLVCLCACMRVLRVIVYAFAFVSCKVAFHVARVCRLHVCVCFRGLGLAGLCLHACLASGYVRVCLCTVLGCVLFCMCVFCVCSLFSCVLECLFVLVCLFRVWLCVRLPLCVLQGCVSHYTRK